LKTFSELELIDPLHRALADEAYTTPTPIQAQTIPAALDGRDVLGCAQTGTGKTAAFALPILNRLGTSGRRAEPNRPQALILAPTRELAIQIGASFATYGKHLKLRQSLVYGGVSQVNQVRSLDRGAHILVATPGRLLDLMNQGYIDLSRLEVFVLDEADRMLDMGFLPDLKKIIAALPQKRQSLFFSATMPPKIVELSQRLLTDPVSVNVTPKSTSVKRIQQQVLFVDRSEKQEILRQLLALDDVERAIVFTRTKRGANVVAEKLLRAGITAVAIHGNKSQNARQRALESFRKQEVRVLVATDVAARGIDIDGITHVVNFDMPVEAESYVHRIGRTGRAGADGIALSFCTSEEYDELLAIEKLIDMPLASANERPPMKASGLPRQLGGGGGGGARRVQKVGGSRRPAASGSSRPVQGYGTETFGGTATRTARPPRRGGPQSGRRTRQPS
jgi:ATP-dependent RNA helicase RhlE